MIMAQCKTKADLHREYARVLEMCEGTELSAAACVRFRGRYITDPVFTNTNDPEDYEFAIAIIEGKAAFLDDELYYDGVKFKGQVYLSYSSDPAWSWNPKETIALDDIKVGAQFLAPADRTLTLIQHGDGGCEKFLCGGLFGNPYRLYDDELRSKKEMRHYLLSIDSIKKEV